MEYLDPSVKQCEIQQLPWLSEADIRLDEPVHVSALEFCIIFAELEVTKLLVLHNARSHGPKFQWREEVMALAKPGVKTAIIDKLQTDLEEQSALHGEYTKHMQAICQQRIEKPVQSEGMSNLCYIKSHYLELCELLSN